MNKIMFSFLIVSMASCKSVASLVDNVNQKKEFETTEEYLEFLNNKIAIPNDKIIILNDNMYSVFLNEIATKQLSTYYGIVNENYFISAEQLEIKSCSGQIETLYKMFEGNSEKITITKKSNIPILEKLNLNTSKNTLLFIYSYKLGRLSKSKISSVINDLSVSDNFDYRIISLDNYDIVNR